MIYLQVLETTNREAVGTIVIIDWIHTTGIKVQIVGVNASNTARPVVAVTTLIVERTCVTIAVAG